MAYLDDHPPASRQFRCPRRAANSGVVVVHTAENTPDFVAFDGGAEAVASFISQRSDPGSYHDLCDSDSIINLVRYECEAFHDGTGTNPHSYGVSGATRADVWPLAPEEWRKGCVRNMALAARRYADWLFTRTGIVIPARRITRDQSTLRTPGFISHAERDPGRRTDPGAGFPWNDFLATFAGGSPPEPIPVSEDDYMPLPVITVPNDPEGRGVFLALDRANKELIRLKDIPGGPTGQQRHTAGVASGLYKDVKTVDAATYDISAADCTRDGEKS